LPPVQPMNEVIEIAEAAQKHGVPAAALCALRIAENGRPGREFGVLSVKAASYEEQVDVAAQSFKNSEARYSKATGKSARKDGRYTTDFLTFFSARWAPIDADNDPQGLNLNHARNLIAAYGWFA